MYRSWHLSILTLATFGCASFALAQSAPVAPVPSMQKCTGGYQPPVVRGSQQSWISMDDYPPSAMRNEEQGVVGVAISVGINGRPVDVEITQRSESETLNAATIPMIMRRARFLPALQNCSPVIGEFETRIRWMLP